MSHFNFNNVIINHKKGNGRFVILVMDNYSIRQAEASFWKYRKILFNSDTAMMRVFM